MQNIQHSGIEAGDAQARCLQMSGMVLILTGIDLEQGLANAHRAVEMLRCTGDSLGHAWALVNVAMAQGICDRFDAARTAYEEFLTVPNAAEHPRLRTWAELAVAWTEVEETTARPPTNRSADQRPGTGRARHPQRPVAGPPRPGLARGLPSARPP